jgi:hypothetical protein
MIGSEDRQLSYRYIAVLGTITFLSLIVMVFVWPQSKPHLSLLFLVAITSIGGWVNSGWIKRSRKKL